MADKFVQLPNDSGNTGKKIRTNERVVGADTVEEHFNILQDRFSDVQGSVLTTAPSGAEGGLVVRNIPSGIQQVAGSVTASLPGQVSVAGMPFVTASVSNFPATQAITGAVGFTEGIAVKGQVNVQGNVTASVAFPATQTITGSVFVINPSGGGGTVVQGSSGSTPWNVAGNVTASVNGTVNVVGMPFVTASVSNFPAIQNVSGSAWTPTVTGSVAVINFPATQAVTGSIAVSNQVSVLGQSGSVVGLLVGGEAVSQANPIPITGSLSVAPPAVQNVTASNWIPTITGSGFPIANVSGAAPAFIEYVGFKNAGGQVQPARVTEYGSIWTAERGTRNIVGSYRAVVTAITGNVAYQCLAALYVPTTASVNCYLKRITVQGQLKPSSIGTNSPLFFYLMARTTVGTLTGSAWAVMQVRSLQPKEQVKVLKLASSATGSGGAFWAQSPGVFMTGAAATWLQALPLPALEESRETDDIVLVPGEGLGIFAEPNGANWVHSIHISWDEGSDA